MMSNKDEQIHIFRLISKGYVLPISIYDKNNIKQILTATFMYEGKEFPILKTYSVELGDVLNAKIDPRFDIDTYLK